MDADLLEALRVRHTDIKERWTTLLRIEPVHTPLGSPEMMIPTIDATLDAVFQAITDGRKPDPGAKETCQCGRNPYLPYYTAGRQALFEALILIQSRQSGISPERRDQAVLDLDRAVGDDVASFGGVCQHRGKARGAPNPSAN